MYKYNYNLERSQLWTKNVNLDNYNKIINPYYLLNMIKDEYSKINNNKYFYFFNINSVFIIFKLNNILLIKSFHISLSKKIEYSNFLIIYLLKYISLNNDIDLKVIKQILLKIFQFLKPFKFKIIKKKQSYNFCKYNYKCKSFVKKKCDFDHFCYTKVCIDIQNIIYQIDKLNSDSLKKYIVTIHYVLEHIYDEYFMYRYINDY